MPWLTYRWDNQMHKELKERYEIIGVPMVLVCDGETGFMITKKGRKDISDIGPRALEQWSDNLPKRMLVEAKNKYGKEVIDSVRVAKEA